MDDEDFVLVKKRKRVFDDFLKIDRYEFSYKTQNGKIQDPPPQLVMERGDSVAVLVHDIERDVVILARQFRIATHGKSGGWLSELPAGSLKENEDPRECAQREVFEELGYDVKILQHISTFFVSPGGTSERIFTFYAPVKATDLVNPDAHGLDQEHENIKRIEISAFEFKKMLKNGTINDAKTLIAGFWFLQA